MSTQSRTSWVAYGVLLTASILLFLAVVWPLWEPLFLAAVLAGILKPATDRISGWLGNRDKLGAALMSTAVVLLLLLPFAAVITIALREALAAYTFVRETLQEGGLNALAGKLPDHLEEPLRDLISRLPVDPQRLSQQAAARGMVAASVIGDILGILSQLLLDLGMFLVAFYAMLLDGKRLLVWLEKISPLPNGQTTELLVRFRHVSRSVVGSSVITAAAQGGVATIGYVIASVPNPLFFGLLTFFAAFLPSVGTAIVAYPLCGLLLLLGLTWQAIFLAVWAAVVVGLVDNLLKPILIRGGVQIHGVVVFFSLIGGMLMLGGIGLIVGPLAVSFFLTMIRFGRRDFAPEEEDALIIAGALPPRPELPIPPP